MPVGAKRVRKRSSLSAGERDLLRYAAETAYVLTPGEMTVADLARQEPFGQVTQSTLERWAHEGNWLARRQEHLQQLRTELRARLGRNFVEDRVRQLEEQQRICDHGLDMLDDEGLQPKSFEGVAQVVVGTYRYMDEMRRNLSLDMALGTPAETQNKGSQPSELSEPIHAEEALAAARALVQARQARLRQAPVAALPEKTTP